MTQPDRYSRTCKEDSTACVDSKSKKKGFDPLFSDAAEFARQSRVLALRYCPTNVRTDVIFGCLPFEEEVIARSTCHPIGEFTVNLATPEDLVILKAIARRDQDLAD